MMKKNIVSKKRTTKEKKKCDSLYDSEKEQLRKYKKEGKNVTPDNLEDEKKEYFKKEDNKRKEKHDNVDYNKREKMKKEDNKRQKEKRDNLEIMKKNW